MSEDAIRKRMESGETELLRPIISAWYDDKGVVAPQGFRSVYLDAIVTAY